MQHKAGQQLLDKYRSGKCTADELIKLRNWFNEIGLDEDAGLSAAELERTSAEIWESICAEKLRRKTVYLWRRIAVTAAAVVTITCGIWLYYALNLGTSHPEFNSGSPLANDIAPGKNKAILTLADGKSIVLSHAKTGIVVDALNLKYNDGSAVQYASGATKNIHSLDHKAQLTVSTPPGGTYAVVLPDGTRVWLNAASSLKFPANFNGLSRRVVELNGEAYFEVIKVSGKLKASGDQSGTEHVPFIVLSNNQEVQVLGTHFNINSYVDEGKTSTTLLEGSVRVLLSGSAGRKNPDAKGIRLRPGQQAILAADRLSVGDADISTVMAWKNGDFRFQREELRAIMRKVARWYDVEIIYAAGVPENVKLGGLISRSKNLSAVLKVIAATGKVHFNLEGRKVTVMAGIEGVLN